MPLTVGQRLGPYEITAAIGSGGMGSVYAGRDTRVGRAVAIKVSSEHFSDRFEKEARAIASLNHPGICTLYDVGPDYIVMELVEGQTLDEVIAAEPNGLPLDRALAIARQIADALDAAHEKGIVHRDLKPGNIKVTPDGAVKVLDFGLAKALEPAGDSGVNLASSATVTSPATQLGTILGTAAYMAPEQARGRPVDKRADIWAFGVVLFEMVTGHRMFQGESISDTLAEVLKRDLPISEAPREWQRMLEACLERDPKKRLRDIGDVWRLLDDGARAPLPAATAVPMKSRWIPIGAAAGAALLAAAAAWMLKPSPPTAGGLLSRSFISVAPADRLQGDARSGGRSSRTALAVSPDGQLIVFAGTRGAQSQLFARPIGALDATAIAGTEGAVNPFFKPDGSAVGFWVGGELRKVPIAGGPAVPVTKVATIFGATWTDDDRIVFGRGSGGLWQVPSGGGTPEELTAVDEAVGEVSHRLPHALPGGDTILFTVTRSRYPKWDETDVVAYSRRTKARAVVINGGADAWYSPSGHLIYVRNAVLMAVPFDLARLERTGDPVGVASQVMQAAYDAGSMFETGAAQFAVSRSGTLAYAAGGVVGDADRKLLWVDRGGRVTPIAMPAGAYVQPRVSPDGRRVVVATSGSRMDLWTLDIATGIFGRLAGDVRAGSPIWSPDSARVAYRSSEQGPDSLFARPSESGGTPQRITTGKRHHVPAFWTPDGTEVVYYELPDDLTSGRVELWAAPVSGTGPPRQLVEGDFAIAGADLSPDGKWLAYATNESGRNEVYVRPFGHSGGQRQVTRDGGQSPMWARRGGRELFYVVTPAAGSGDPFRMMSLPIATESALTIGQPSLVFERRFGLATPARAYDVTPDGQRFVVVDSEELPPTSVTQIVLVQNWFDELRRIAPAK